MKKLRYSLIVSDFDGTLVNNDGTISDINKKAITDYIAAGGAFAISTGRMPSGILPRARELGLKGMVSCCQGAIIMDIESGEAILQERIPFETTLQICRKMEEMNLHIHLYDLWDYYANMDDDALKFYENAVKTKAKLVLDKPLSQFVEEKALSSYKVLAMVETEDNKRVYDELLKEPFIGCSLTKSSENLVEVINSKYTKGTAVEFLANYYNTSLEQTIAIGDQHNDLPMILKAGLGVAVKNADELLQSSANYVCDATNNEGAIARIIEKFAYVEEE